MDQFIKPTKTYTSTRLIFVLDRSGSMASIRDDTIGGFNTFVDDQRKLEGDATLTLVQFDNNYEVNYADVPVSQVAPLSVETFVPRGGTALYDAVGRTISEAISTDRDGVKTIVAVLTDGQENASREFSWQAVNALVTQVQDERDWEVLFVGANMDAVTIGGSLGIKASNVSNFSASGKGIGDVMKAVADTTVLYRSAAYAGVTASASLADAYEINAAITK